MHRGRISKALLVLALVAMPVGGARAASGPRCESVVGRYLLPAPLLVGPITTGTHDAVVIGPNDLEIISGCPPESLKDSKIGSKKGYTRVIAVWKNCGDARQVR